jgi:hypothetical protein
MSFLQDWDFLHDRVTRPTDKDWKGGASFTEIFLDIQNAVKDGRLTEGYVCAGGAYTHFSCKIEEGELLLPANGYEHDVLQLFYSKDYKVVTIALLHDLEYKDYHSIYLYF